MKPLIVVAAASIASLAAAILALFGNLGWND